MLILNNIKFARNSKELVSSLFDATGTASGYYKIRKNGILLTDAQKEPISFIVNNKHGELFIVSAHRASDGKTYYMYALSDSDAKRLGFEGMTLAEETEALRKALDTI